jgi:Lipase
MTTSLRRYVNSVENGPRVGRYIARFLKSLIVTGLPLHNIHVIGFSLGVSRVARFIDKLLPLLARNDRAAPDEILHQTDYDFFSLPVVLIKNKKPTRLRWRAMLARH